MVKPAGIHPDATARKPKGLGSGPAFVVHKWCITGGTFSPLARKVKSFVTSRSPEVTSCWKAVANCRRTLYFAGVGCSYSKQRRKDFDRDKFNQNRNT